jgi:hypothetical protein
LKRLQYSLLAAVGVLILALVLTAVGPQRVMAALGYTPVRDVDNPGLQPFQQTVVYSGGNGNSATSTLTVPAGKRLVVEHVSGVSFGPNPATITLGANAAGSEPVIFLTVHDFFAPTVFASYHGDADVRFYAEPGSVIGVNAYRDSTSATAFFGRLTVIGHLVSVP